MFGSTGRFSQDIDVDATHKNGFEADIEAAFAAHAPYYGIRFSVPQFRYSQDDNFSGTVHYEHDNGEGTFELQISCARPAAPAPPTASDDPHAPTSAARPRMNSTHASRPES